MHLLCTLRLNSDRFVFKASALLIFWIFIIAANYWSCASSSGESNWALSSNLSHDCLAVLRISPARRWSPHCAAKWSRVFPSSLIVTYNSLSPNLLKSSFIYYNNSFRLIYEAASWYFKPMLNNTVLPSESNLV